MPIMKEIKTPLVLFNIHYFKDEKGTYYKKKGDEHRIMVRPFWKMKRIKLGIPVLFVLALGFAGYKIGISLASEKMVNELVSQMTKEDYDNLLKDPSVQQIIAKELGSDQKSALLNNLSSNSTIKDAISKEHAPSSNGQDTHLVTNNGSGKVMENVDSNKDKETMATSPVSNKDQNTAATEETSKDTSNVEQPSEEKADPGLQFSSDQEVMKFLLSKFSMAELSEFAKKAQGGVTAQEKEEIKNSVLGRLTTEEYNAVKVFAVLEISKGQ